MTKEFMRLQEHRDGLLRELSNLDLRISMLHGTDKVYTYHMAVRLRGRLARELDTVMDMMEVQFCLEDQDM
jgi:hypothetical protein